MSLRLLIGWFAAAIAGFAIPALAAGSSLPRALLITGLGTADPEHPLHHFVHPFYNDKIVEILEGIVEVTVTDDLSTLNDADLRAYDVVLNNSYHLEPTQEQFDALYRYVEQGNAFVALHAGLVSFLNSDRYYRMMGGRFIGHDTLKTLSVETFADGYGVPQNAPIVHPIARGVPDFNTRDELYVVQTNTIDLEVIARSESHPIVWLHRWGKGRVLAFALGHGEDSLANAGYQALLKNSIRWIVGYPLIEPIHARVFPAKAASVDDYIDLDEVSHHREDAPLTFDLVNSHPDLVQASVDQDNRLDLRFTGRQGTAIIAVQAEDPNGRMSSTEFKIAIRKRGASNLSVFDGASTHTSSNEFRYSTSDPSFVADGDLATRWSSHYGDDNWIYVDLGVRHLVDRVKLFWEPAYAKQYQIQVSNDASAWRIVHTEKNGRGGTEEITFDPVNARYVRMLGLQRATPYGYSLYEFEIYRAASD